MLVGVLIWFAEDAWRCIALCCTAAGRAAFPGWNLADRSKGPAGDQLQSFVAGLATVAHSFVSLIVRLMGQIHHLKKLISQKWRLRPDAREKVESAGDAACTSPAATATVADLKGRLLAVCNGILTCSALRIIFARGRFRFLRVISWNFRF